MEFLSNKVSSFHMQVRPIVWRIILKLHSGAFETARDLFIKEDWLAILRHEHITNSNSWKQHKLKMPLNEFKNPKILWKELKNCQK